MWEVGSYVYVIQSSRETTGSLEMVTIIINNYQILRSMIFYVK
jgi:hypothetical protein